MQRGCLHSVGRTTHTICLFSSYIMQAFLILPTRLDRKCLDLRIKRMQEAILGYVLATLHNRAIIEPICSQEKKQGYKILKYFIKTKTVSLPFSVRRQMYNCGPDFSVRQKKIYSRKPKMDIYSFFKNVQNTNLIRSLVKNPGIKA